MRTNTHKNAIGDHVSQHGPGRTKAVELIEYQSNHAAGLLIRIQRIATFRWPDVSDRRADEYFASSDLVQQALTHAVPQHMQLGLRHDPRQAQEQAVIVIRRVVQAILIRQQRTEQAAQFEQLMPVLARTS
jgi:hypothetical protein